MMTDWFHRDCSIGYCHWMIPNDFCKSTREEVNKIDPSRTMTKEEINESLCQINKGNYKTTETGLLIPYKD